MNLGAPASCRRVWAKHDSPAGMPMLPGHGSWVGCPVNRQAGSPPYDICFASGECLIKFVGCFDRTILRIMGKDFIKIGGAREHNLKNLTLTIPRDKLVVVTGLSGSGKSSLAVDTIYAEGQRKYVESLSAYARQFLEQLQKPDVDHIEGLSPAIAIEQRTAVTNPRSTIATTTEIYEYLRLLYASIGNPHCHRCGKA